MLIHLFVRAARSALLAVGAAAFIALPAWPQQPAAAAAPVSQITLDNGLTVIVKPDHRAPTAIHMLWVRVGSIDEVDGTSGIAHMQEHMMFKGTDQLAPGEFSRRVAALGGQENAFTSYDFTAYFQQVPASRLREVMALEADRLAHNRWSDEEFAKELEVVKEERRMRTEDNPRAVLHEQQSAATFIASPYRRPVIGWMGDLDALTAQNTRDFYRQWYTPANAAVVVVGDVDPQAVFDLARQAYGGIPSQALPQRKPRPEPTQIGLRRIEVKAPAEQALVSLA
ncbi:MAG: insulinase family protein, partial [Burkholderiaceae bacterium]|nr:insulinase family protein [Burkholderiaceae bacterium]